MTDGGVSFKGLSYFVGIGGCRVIPSIPGSGEQVLSLSVHILLPDDVGEDHRVEGSCWISSHIAGCY